MPILILFTFGSFPDNFKLTLRSALLKELNFTPKGRIMREGSEFRSSQVQPIQLKPAWRGFFFMNDQEERKSVGSYFCFSPSSSISVLRSKVNFSCEGKRFKLFLSGLFSSD